jgi:hypothetical protein
LATEKFQTKGGSLDMKRCRVLSLFVVLFCCFCSNAASRAQQAASAATGGGEDLQKATQNPVASLISVPVQNNSNFGIGPYDRTQNVLNIQPVIPMKVSDCCNLIIRWIAPIIFQPAPGTANLEVYGINENTPAFFLRPRRCRRTQGYRALEI